MILSCKIKINFKFVLNFNEALEFYAEKIPLQGKCGNKPI